MAEVVFDIKVNGGDNFSNLFDKINKSVINLVGSNSGLREVAASIANIRDSLKGQNLQIKFDQRQFVGDMSKVSQVIENYSDGAQKNISKVTEVTKGATTAANNSAKASSDSAKASSDSAKIVVDNSIRIGDQSKNTAQVLNNSGVIISESNKKTEASIKSVDNSTKSLDNSTKNLDKTFNQQIVNIQRLRTSFGILADSMRPVQQATLKIGSGFIDAAGKQEQWNIAFETMTGSAETAEKLMEDIYKLALKSPFTIPDVVEQTKKLMAYGRSANVVIDDMKILGDIAAGVGTDKLPYLTLAFGQVATKGKLMGQEVRQFSEAGVPLAEALRIKFGLVADAQGHINASFEQTRAALKDLAKNRFGDLMAKQAETALGQASNLKDALFILNVYMGKALLPTFKKAVEGLISLIQKLQGMSEGTRNLIIFLGSFVLISTTLLVILGNLARAFFNLAELNILLRTRILATAAAFDIAAINTTIFTIAIKGLLFIINPFGAIITAIAASLALFTFGKLKDLFDEFKRASEAKKNAKTLSESLDTILEKLKTHNTAAYAEIIKMRRNREILDLSNDFSARSAVLQQLQRQGFVKGVNRKMKEETDAFKAQVDSIIKKYARMNEQEVQEPARALTGDDSGDKELENLKKKNAEKLQEEQYFRVQIGVLKQSEADLYNNASQIRKDIIQEEFNEKKRLLEEDRRLETENALFKNQLALKTWEGQLEIASKFLGDMQSVRDLNSKEAFDAYKAFAIAEAGIDAVSAVTKTLGAYPFPLNIAMAAGASVPFIAQIAKLEAMKFAVGTDSVPNDMLANIHKGEAIIPARENQFLQSGKLALVGAGSGATNNSASTVINVNLDGAKFMGKMDRQDVFNLGAQLSDAIRQRFIPPLAVA